MSPLQVQRLQQLWRNTAAVRLHQRQLLFMQLQRFTERRAAKLVRTGAAFLSGATFSASSASATRKGTSASTPVSKTPSEVSRTCHILHVLLFSPPFFLPKPCLLQSHVDA